LFLISACLITTSAERSPTYRQYLAKGILRTYPGYVVACIVSILIAAPLAGDDITTLIGFNDLAHGFRVLFLRTPYVENALHGLPHALLYQPIWTIAARRQRRYSGLL
jgi:peptidoglycan/LPS O-acetylase OafA/YrhL